MKHETSFRALALTVLAGLTAPATLALYPLAIAPWTYTTEAKLVPSTVMPDDDFGTSTAIQGNRAVAGAYRFFPATSPGSAWVFERQGSAWTEVAELQGSDALPGESFGVSVALDGDRIVVGADDHAVAGVTRVGAAYVFEKGPGGWQQTAKLLASDGMQNDNFGRSVAASGTTIVIGAVRDDVGSQVDTGSAYVFEQVGGVWTELQKVTPTPNQGDQWFGDALALDGDTLAVGAYQHDFGGDGAGAVFVYAREAGVWSQEDWFFTNDPESPASFGTSIDLDGDRLVAGAPRDSVVNGSLQEEGAAYVFVRSGGNWTQEAELRAPAPAFKTRFGAAVTIEGSWVLVGSPSEDPGGFGYAFQREGTDWIHRGTLSSQDPELNDSFGVSVALSGSTALFGVSSDDTTAGLKTGSVDVIRIQPGTPVSYCTAGTSASGCQAAVSAAGTASASAGSGFVVSVQAVEGLRSGMFFYGSNGRQAAPWGNGTSYQCIAPPVRRGGTQAGNGTAGLCDGAFAQDLNAHWVSTPYLNPGPGATVQVQFWYRDPQNTSNQTTSLSDALEFNIEL